MSYACFYSASMQQKINESLLSSSSPGKINESLVSVSWLDK